MVNVDLIPPENKVEGPMKCYVSENSWVAILDLFLLFRSEIYNEYWGNADPVSLA